MSKRHTEKIREIRLWRREKEGSSPYFVGDFGSPECKVNLSELRVILFDDRDDPRHKLLILKEK